ncbi:MAG: aspartate aminotransferase family protein [Proteobacteria bacterium]|nr:aspartate aminotransferase family protein [Pseudomonadota bacterium]
MNTREKYQAYVNTAFLPAVDPLVIDRARGATYVDPDGQSFLDCFSGISVANAGHGNEAVIAAAKAQMDRLVHCCSYLYHVRPVADLAEKLARITPGNLQKSFFGSGGAEAVEGAIRLARRHTGRSEMVALTHSFHGRSYATLSLTGNAGRKKGGGPYMPGVAFAPAPYCYRCPFKLGDPETCGMACAQYLDDVIRYQTSDDVAFFIAEPVLGEGGIIAPPPEYFKVVKQVLDHHGVLFMADEVQTGFGRTGRMFAIEECGTNPDIMVMAKGIANGFPLSCFIAPAEIADSFRPGDHLSTFGGNPVSCAAALANIGFLEENGVPAAAARKGEVIRQGLLGTEPGRVVLGQVRGRGLMIGVEMVSHRADKTPAPQEAARIRAALRERGVLIGLGGVHGNVLRIQPPLTISDDEIGQLLSAMKAVLES